jgi:hypothetical protein
MSEEDWLTARDRAVLYVRALALPPLEGLEFAVEALRRAQAGVLRDPGLSPTAETMRRLRELLAERRPEALESLEVKSQPSLNRGPMVPETMDRRPWRVFPTRPRRGPAFRL